MKNIINIFLFYFLTAILNIWCEVGVTSDMVWAVATEVVEAEEREKEEQVDGYAAHYEKINLKGAGGSGVKEIIAIEQKPRPFIPLFNTLVPVTYSEETSLKQYQNRLINSIYSPKLYILFRCPKTFLS